MQDYKHLFTKTALELTKSYINFMRQPCIIPAWYFHFEDMPLFMTVNSYRDFNFSVIVSLGWYDHLSDARSVDGFDKWVWPSVNADLGIVCADILPGGLFFKFPPVAIP